MTKTLQDKVVLLTGASSGIGRMTALILARLGCHVVGVSRREHCLDALVREIADEGADATAFPGDVTRPDTMVSAVQHCLDQFGRIDILINNAGQGLFASLEQTSPQDLEHMLAVNLKSVFYGIVAALPAMRRQGRGHIINVASTAGRRGSPFVGAYCASKFAVVGLTESLRAELMGSGIHVSLFCPGATDTPFFGSALRRTERHQGLVGPVETASQVAARIASLIQYPRAEVIAQPFRRRLLLMLNLLAPRLVDRLVTHLVASQSHAVKPDAFR